MASIAAMNPNAAADMSPANFPRMPKAAPGKLSRRSRLHLAHWLVTECQWPQPKAHAAIKAYISWMRRVAADMKAGRLAPDAVPEAPNATIAAVWATHVLYAPDYAVWCALATDGGFIHHAPAHVDCQGSQPQAAAADPQSSLTTDATGAARLSEGFRERLAAVLSREHGWPAGKAAQHVAEYEAWWWERMVPQARGCGDAGAAAALPPSFEVDDVWHAHVQHTREYAAWCLATCGPVSVYHAPAVMWAPGTPPHVRCPDRHAERQMSITLPHSLQGLIALIMGGGK